MKNTIVDTITSKKLKQCTYGTRVLDVDSTLEVIDYLDNRLSDIDLNVAKALDDNEYLLSMMKEIFGRFGAYVH